VFLYQEFALYIAIGIGIEIDGFRKADPDSDFDPDFKYHTWGLCMRSRDILSVLPAAGKAKELYAAGSAGPATAH